MLIFDTGGYMPLKKGTRILHKKGWEGVVQRYLGCQWDDATEAVHEVYAVGLDPTSKPIRSLVIDFIVAPKPVKLTEVQRAHRDDPEVLDLIWALYAKGGATFVSCQSSRREYEASKLSSISSLTEIEALDYISEATDKTHGPKYYLTVPNEAPPEFFERVGAYFCVEAHPSKQFVQFNTRSLVEWVIKEHGVLPVKRY
jgi:hypothetical protein